MLQKYCIALEDIVYWAQCGALPQVGITTQEGNTMIKVLDNVYDLVTLNMVSMLQFLAQNTSSGMVRTAKQN